MALIFLLKESQKAIVAYGDIHTLKKDIQDKWKDDDYFLVRSIDDIFVLIAKDHISHIEVISEKELQRRKDAYEAEKKKILQRQGKITILSMKFPSGKIN